jgi:hypothetical protein
VKKRTVAHEEQRKACKDEATTYGKTPITERIADVLPEAAPSAARRFAVSRVVPFPHLLVGTLKGSPFDLFSFTVAAARISNEGRAARSVTSWQRPAVVDHRNPPRSTR